MECLTGFVPGQLRRPFWTIPDAGLFACQWTGQDNSFPLKMLPYTRRSDVDNKKMRLGLYRKIEIARDQLPDMQTLVVNNTRALERLVTIIETREHL